MQNQRVLIITGMHRSGTSLVASILQHAGVDIGAELLPPYEGNPHGHFEDLDFFNFHEELLRYSEQRIFSDSDFHLNPPRKEDKEKALELLAQRQDSEMWGWKDPRTTLFLQLWSGLLPQARFLFVFRHPIEVALSLLRRGSEVEILASSFAGLHSWQEYNESILNFYRRHSDRCFLCDIYNVVEDAGGVVESVSQKLNLPLQSEGAQSLVHREELSLCCAVRGVDAVFQQIAPQVARLYGELQIESDLPPKAAEDLTAQDPELIKRLDAVAGMLRGSVVDPAMVRSVFSLVLAILDPEITVARGADLQDRIWSQEQNLKKMRIHVDHLETGWAQDQDHVRELTDHGKDLTRLLAQRDGELAGLNAEVESLSGQVERLHAERERLHAERERLHAERERLCTDIATLEAFKDRDQARIRELQAEAGDLGRQLAEREEQLHELDTALRESESLRAELGQRLSHADAENARSEEQIRQLEQELARTSNELRRISSSRWVRFLHRVHLFE